MASAFYPPESEIRTRKKSVHFPVWYLSKQTPSSRSLFIRVSLPCRSGRKSASYFCWPHFDLPAFESRAAYRFNASIFVARYSGGRNASVDRAFALETDDSRRGILESYGNLIYGSAKVIVFPQRFYNVPPLRARHGVRERTRQTEPLSQRVLSSRRGGLTENSHSYVASHLSIIPIPFNDVHELNSSSN